MNGRCWEAHDLELLSILAQSPYCWTDGEIARYMDRNRNCVRIKRTEMNIPPGQPACLRAMMVRINVQMRRAAA